MQIAKGLLLTMMSVLMLSAGGCWTIRTDHVQTVEMVVSTPNGHPASEVNVYQYGGICHMNPSPKSASHFASRESELRKHRPELLRYANHRSDATGVVVVPVFDTYWDHAPIPFWTLIFPCRVEHTSGIAGQPCTIAVDDGENLDTMFVQMQPGASVKGDHYQIEVRALSPPKPYSLPDK